MHEEAIKIFNDINFLVKKLFFKFTPGGFKKKAIAAAERLYASAKIQPERKQSDESKFEFKFKTKRNCARK